ncbi:hypothetical protein HMPREF0653_02754 [Prevotella disiens JCM 6334 = ATCC 29426]|uniref:Uncharacterized protein n=1 Tax=Prevotella disiens JCM 6334 = ATCC 29426 TaxID=1235811 RepID=A0ABN0NND0_9BACT|nr:hypothetical protein HMPREF0653_02754 [Prevotella disiens JCM 6334 = ATCC 29426]
MIPKRKRNKTMGQCPNTESALSELKTAHFIFEQLWIIFVFTTLLL